MATYYIVSGGFEPIHEGHLEMIKCSAAASDGVIVPAYSECYKTGLSNILASILTELCIFYSIKFIEN